MNVSSMHALNYAIQNPLIFDSLSKIDNHKLNRSYVISQTAAAVAGMVAVLLPGAAISLSLLAATVTAVKLWDRYSTCTSKFCIEIARNICAGL